MQNLGINLCLNLCPWAGFHHNKGAMKIHTAIDLDGNLPDFMVMTPAKVPYLKLVSNYSQRKNNSSEKFNNGNV